MDSDCQLGYGRQRTVESKEDCSRRSQRGSGAAVVETERLLQGKNEMQLGLTEGIRIPVGLWISKLGNPLCRTKYVSCEGKWLWLTNEK